MRKSSQLVFQWDQPQPPAPTRNEGSDSHLLRTIWADLIREYFPHRTDLHSYSIRWSTRPQSRTLASVNLQTKVVRVARELNEPQFSRFVPPLLYHEMCHAVLGKEVAQKGGRRQWHGREFKALEKRHPGIKKLDLWIKSGGWEYAVRCNRVKHSQRKNLRIP